MEQRLETTVIKNCRTEKDGFIFAKKDAQILYNINSGILNDYNYLVFDVENKEEYSVCINTSFWESDLEKKCDLFVATGILPNIKTSICIPLLLLSGGILFGKRYPGVLKTVVKGNKLNLNAIHTMGIGLPSMHKETSLTISNVRLTKEAVYKSLSLEKQIDDMGQYKYKEWPMKTKSTDDNKKTMLETLAKAREFLKTHTDGYYGDTTKQYNATGFFRIEQEGERFFFITPDGQRFFSTGVDCIGSGIMASCDDDNNQKNFLNENLMRAFLETWYESWCDITKYRMIQWNINTIAAWSDEKFSRYAKIPYVKFLRNFPKTSTSIYRDFPDVFSPEYQKSAAEYAEQLIAEKEEPYLIGYFMSNEPHWAFVDNLNLGYELLRNHNDLHTKEHFLTFIKERYQDDITALNKNWEMNFQAFHDLSYLGEFPVLNDAAMKDLSEFSCIMVNEYIKVPAMALKAVDPMHLNLGLRYAYISSDALYSGSEYFDVFSINCYENTCNKAVKKVFEKTKKPIMIGEYHFGAIDAGLPATGIRGVTTQIERGKAIRRYVEHAAALDCCVGVHYFQWNDQGFLGRFDGENYNIGLVDICNNAYDSVVEQFKMANQRIYAVADKTEEPYDEEIAYIPAIFY